MTKQPDAAPKPPKEIPAAAPLIEVPADVYRQWNHISIMLPTWDVEVLWKGLDGKRRVGYVSADRVLHLRTIDNDHCPCNLRSYTYWRPFLR